MMTTCPGIEQIEPSYLSLIYSAVATFDSILVAIYMSFKSRSSKFLRMVAQIRTLISNNYNASPRQPATIMPAQYDDYSELYLRYTTAANYIVPTKEIKYNTILSILTSFHAIHFAFPCRISLAILFWLLGGPSTNGAEQPSGSLSVLRY
jgi:hypothetical protein